jgi:hypothetical protein
MTDYETPHERRARLVQAQTRLEEERQRITTNRMLCAITALVILLMLAFLRRYALF